MKVFTHLAYFFLIFISSSVFAQDADSDTTVEKESKLPVLSFAPGVLNFLGDAGYNHFNEPLTAKCGFEIEVQKHTTSGLAVSLFILSGKVFGEEKTSVRQVNFVSNIFSEGLKLRYDFRSRTRSDQILTPYISAGFEYMSFHPMGDLKDANGNDYHYWSDGSIRSLDQHDVNASQAKIVYRDYNYETDLREADIDSIGKYRQSTIAFPIGLGVRFRLSGRCSMNFGTEVHFTSSDVIDNINSSSKGANKGNSKNDKIIFSFVSFRYDFAAPRDVPKKSGVDKKGDYKNVDYNAIALEDADHDGIPDIYDDVIDTAQNMKVDAQGKPIDSDGDGIPDYRDDEPKSPKGAIVDEHGVTITEEMIEERWKKDSLSALPVIVEYLHSVDKLAELKKKRNGPVSDKPEAPKAKGPYFVIRYVPNIYAALDVDDNHVISAGEITKAIDDYLAGKSPYSKQQFYELIDFFFSQQ